VCVIEGSLVRDTCHIRVQIEQEATVRILERRLDTPSANAELSVPDPSEACV
jgi:hypothetical protein